jgi:predicted Zn finger-like uncharacterized protein
MLTRCPNCTTEYDIDESELTAGEGLARCHRCNTVFEAYGQQPADPRGSIEPLELTLQSEAHWKEEPTEVSPELPFDVPDDLEPLEPSPDAALDVEQTLNEKRSLRKPFYAVLALLLTVGLGLQFAWQQRVELLRQYPQLAPLCDRLHCIANQVHAPEQLRVLQRQLQPADNQPGRLNLNARIRNDATANQRLPDIQLSLLDTDGKVLVRRRLAPRDYLYPPPPSDRVIAPGEVITISVDFKDPGHLATGFMIDFL